MEEQEPLVFSELWDRFRSIARSVSDVKALREITQERSDRAQSNAENTRERISDAHGEDYNRMLDEKASEWHRRYQQEQEKVRVFSAMLNYFVSHPDPQCPPPSFDKLDKAAERSMKEGYALLEKSDKATEIFNAIRRVLERDDVPDTATNFYAEVDRERGLSGDTRATEGWVRNNERNPVPPPDYWREEFGM
jgi:hypothetical protein